jgi:hypothetical protein
MGLHTNSEHIAVLDMAPPSCHSGESDCVELQSPSPACDRQNASPSASDSSSASSPSSPRTTFIACATPLTPPPSETDTHPENTAPNRVGRRGQYPCLHPSCSRVLTSPYTRQVHMGTHAPKPRKAFLCTMGCGEVFTRQHDRHRHEVALHGKKCTHVCARCKRFFSTAKMLDRHVCRGHRQGAIQWPLGGKLPFGSCNGGWLINYYCAVQMMRLRMHSRRRRPSGRARTTDALFY